LSLTIPKEEADDPISVFSYAVKAPETRRHYPRRVIADAKQIAITAILAILGFMLGVYGAWVNPKLKVAQTLRSVNNPS